MLEEQALDSYGNLLFGILRFWKEVGRWPEKVTIVSHGFKRGRFLDLHVPATRWPEGRVEFLGIDPEYMVEDEIEMGSKGTADSTASGSLTAQVNSHKYGKRTLLFDKERTAEVLKGERERGYKAWEDDPQGTGEALSEKRRKRNFWDVIQLFFETEEERRSGVKSWQRDGEEGLEDAVQPWVEDFKQNF